MSGCRRLYCPEQNRPECDIVPLIRDYEQDERDKEEDEIVSGYSTNYKCLSCGVRYRIEVSNV